jgi:hypothetical protein
MTPITPCPSAGFLTGQAMMDQLVPITDSSKRLPAVCEKSQVDGEVPVDRVEKPQAKAVNCVLDEMRSLRFQNILKPALKSAEKLSEDRLDEIVGERIIREFAGDFGAVLKEMDMVLRGRAEQRLVAPPPHTEKSKNPTHIAEYKIEGGKKNTKDALEEPVKINKHESEFIRELKERMERRKKTAPDVLVVAGEKVFLNQKTKKIAGVQMKANEEEVPLVVSSPKDGFQRNARQPLRPITTTNLLWNTAKPTLCGSSKPTPELESVRQIKKVRVVVPPLDTKVQSTENNRIQMELQSLRAQRKVQWGATRLVR